MKNFLTPLALVTLLLSGCSKNDANQAPTQEERLSFGTFAYSMTRGPVAMSDNIKLFGVNPDAPTAGWFFNQQLLTYTSTTADFGQYVYTPLRYWPLQQTLGLNFYASAPYESTTAIGWPAAGATIDTMALITYTVPATANEDFKMARLRGVKKTATNDPVILTFEHMLSKVTLGVFEFANVMPGYTAAATKFELIGLANQGTRAFNADPTDAWNGPTGTTGNYSRSSTGPAGSLLTDPMYIMPQTFINTDSLAYTITLTGDASVGGGTDTKRVSIALTDILKSNWQSAEKGKNYVLNLYLDANRQFDIIKFEANVNDWTPNDVTMPVVQPTAQKLNSMLNNDEIPIGGTSATNKFKLTGTITWDWSNAAIYQFNGLAATGDKFKLTFAGVLFDPGAQIIINVPATGFKIYNTTSADTQTVTVTGPSASVWIEKK